MSNGLASQLQASVISREGDFVQPLWDGWVSHAVDAANSISPGSAELGPGDCCQLNAAAQFGQRSVALLKD